MEKPLVSINCITYNQEDFIEETIKSFLMQKTTFKFEVLIHDDASTDKTPDIIRAYENKYPDIIKAIYQVENQYSKGVKVADINFQRAQGEFMAICEGDDYWTHPEKLQKQVDYLVNNPKCGFTFHASVIVDENGKEVGKVHPYKSSRIAKTSDIIKNGGGFLATNSMVFRTPLMKNPPQYYKKSAIGDYPIQMYLSTKEYGYYLNEEMSAYRTGVSTSWSGQNMRSGDFKKKIKHNENSILMLKMFNEANDYKYSGAINKRVDILEMANLLYKTSDSNFNIKQSQYYQSLSMIKKLIFLAKYFKFKAKN